MQSIVTKVKVLAIMDLLKNVCDLLPDGRDGFMVATNKIGDKDYGVMLYEWEESAYLCVGGIEHDVCINLNYFTADERFRRGGVLKSIRNISMEEIEFVIDTLLGDLSRLTNKQPEV